MVLMVSETLNEIDNQLTICMCRSWRLRWQTPTWALRMWTGCCYTRPTRRAQPPTCLSGPFVRARLALDVVSWHAWS